jgi:5S rRNA maturation endonuclease (ribonuclease M5)
MARTKRLDDSGESRGMSRTVQRRATTLIRSRYSQSSMSTTRRSANPTTFLQRQRMLSDFTEFLSDMVKELNELSGEGGAVLVEGKRDVRALKALGYTGPLFTIAILTSSEASREKLREDVRQMVILTDLDSEGRRLAARYFRFLSQEGVKPSLAHRRRLSTASRGVFRHIENLVKFAPEEEGGGGGECYPGSPAAAGLL